MAQSAEMALLLSLRDKGWEVIVEPGRFFCRQENIEINPMGLVARLEHGIIQEAEWLKTCQEGGITDMQLWRDAFESPVTATGDGHPHKTKSPAATTDEGPLPEIVWCPFCSEGCQLEEDERTRGSFECPTCGKVVEKHHLGENPSPIVGEVDCPSCGTVLEVDEDELQNLEHVCPHCQAAVSLNSIRWM